MNVKSCTIYTTTFLWLICISPFLLAQSPGVLVGTTWYDSQTNGSTGNRIAVCDDGSIYMCWQNLYGWPYGEYERHIHYAWFDPSGAVFDSGRVDIGDNAGYATLDIIYGNRAAIAYHWYGTATPRVMLAIDSLPPGQGNFAYFDPPDSLFSNDPAYPGDCYWPYVAVNTNNIITLVMTENTPAGARRMMLTGSEDGGQTWRQPNLADTAMVIGTVLDASPVSDKTVFAWPEPLDHTSQWRNDIGYIVSEDGWNWDWAYEHCNITDYEYDSDSLWAYTDMDAIFDYDDNVHLVWNARRIDDEGLHNPIYLFHYCDATDEITEITHHPESDYWMDIGGTWNLTICKMNMGVCDIEDGNDGIFVTWTQFDTSDVSAHGYGNGELYMSYSIDNGLTWSLPENLTNSPTPGCQAGDCDNDNWSSLADVVDDSLHIIYMNDKDPAASTRNEGLPTESPVMYLAVPNPLTTGIDDDVSLPINLVLHQNYPNPFNNETVISFELRKSSLIKLAIYDITGRLIESLIDEPMPSGQHHIIWRAEGLASGIYFYTLSSGDNLIVRKALVVK